MSEQAKHTSSSTTHKGTMDEFPTYLSGQLLVAMPNLSDPRFQKAVIFMCAHSEQGAMGLIVNKPLHQLPYPELLSQLSLPVPEPEPNYDVIVHFGGPVETERGFVLHSDDYEESSSLRVGPGLALTATSRILSAIGEGRGPEQTLLALGYAGWAPGQLDTEMQENGWLTVEADSGLIFDYDLESKWDRAIAKMGIDTRLLSGDMGHA